MRVRVGARVAIATTAAAMSIVAFPGVHAANDPHQPRQWNMSLIGAEAAWATGTGKGVTIAVVDSGVDIAHEDLKAKVIVPGRNFVASGPAHDDHGHGTHVAGIAAAMTNNGRGVVGVAPDAAILPVKVLDRDGNGTYSDAIAAVRWAADNGAHVINLSLGSTVSSLTGSPNGFIEAIRYAWSKGVICVVAAGNDFVLSSDFEDEPAIVVSATTERDTAAVYSNGVGGAEWGMAAPGGGPDTFDPLLDEVYSTRPTDRYRYLAGTSMAAPHVAGAAAVLRSLGLSPRQTVDRLLATAKDLGARGRDDLYGHGRLDLAKAVAGLAPPKSTPTSSASAQSQAHSRSQPQSQPSGSAPSGATSATASRPADPARDQGPGAGASRGDADSADHEDPDDSNDAALTSSGGPERRSQRTPWAPALAALALEAAAIVGLVRVRARPRRA